jgi:hypothetical protein
MKKLLLILFCLPLVFSSCKKECHCGDVIDSGILHGVPDSQQYHLVVQNECTSNIDTFYVDDIETLQYYQRDAKYCEGSW